MVNINIAEQIAGEGGWVFDVTVAEEAGETKHTVSLPRQYYRTLVQGKMTTPEEFIEKSFRFLLSREPKEAILPLFSVSEIPQFFPDYEAEIARAL